MEIFFLTLLNRSAAAGWVVLAVLLLRLLLGKAPKWIRVVLWGFAAFRLIAPVTPESRFSLVRGELSIPQSFFLRGKTERQETRREMRGSCCFPLPQETGRLPVWHFRLSPCSG